VFLFMTERRGLLSEKKMTTKDLKWLRENRALLTSLGEEPAVLSAVEVELAKDASRQKSKAFPPEPPARNPMHGTWERAIDPKTGYPYLYNASSGESTWEDLETDEQNEQVSDLEQDHRQEEDDDDADYDESDEEDCCCCPQTIGMQRRRRLNTVHTKCASSTIEMKAS